LPPDVCGDDANITCAECFGTLCVNGTVPAPLSMAMTIPGRFESKEMFTRFGVTVTCFVSVRPPLSVTVSEITK
jgi:hypothetical protein